MGSTGTNQMGYLEGHYVAGPNGGVVTLEAQKILSFDAGTANVNIQTGSLTIGGSSDVDVIFNKGSSDPAFTYDHGLGNFHAVDNCKITLGNTAAAPDAYIYGNGTGIKIDINDSGCQYGIITGDPSGVGTGSKIGFYSQATVARQTVVGARGGYTGIVNLTTALANLGLITDGTT
jgi:hypothetical protein